MTRPTPLPPAAQCSASATPDARLPDLPVTEILPDLARALETGNSAVLVAPPGAGKTTLVPLALLDAPWLGAGKIVLLEPRRLAARAAARRMASLLGEEPGETVGYAMRMENRTSARTRILVVTEGVLARMILDDPELPGVSAVLFDEFHERSLDGDFGLALALDVQGALRPDLKLLVMSATLDGARVAKLMAGAPVIESLGRSFPVELRYEERAPGTPIEDAMAKAIRETLAQRDRQRARLPARPARDRAHRRAARRPHSRRLRHRAALRHARRQGAGRGDQACARRPPQDRARNLDRRDVDHHRRRARRHRFRPVAPAEIRTGDGADPAGDGARQQGLRRPARRPRRPHASRHRDQAVARRADGRAAGLHAAGNPAGRSLRHDARLRRLRRRRSGDASLPRPAAGAGTRRGARAAARARRHRRSRPSHPVRRGHAQTGAAGAARAYGRRGGEDRAAA